MNSPGVAFAASATIALSLAAISSAEPSGKEAMLTGIGVRTCSQFAQDYQASPQGAEMRYFDWADGYASGYNWAQVLGAITHPKGAKIIDLSDQSNFRRNVLFYCDQHPLQPFMIAVDNVLYEAPKVPIPEDH